MDKNTITGLVLIGILLVGFSFLSRPSEEQIAAQKRYYDSIALVQQQEEALKAKTEAALANSKKEAASAADSSSLFFNALQGTDSKVSIQNNVAEITFTTKGGRVYSAMLKDYMAFSVLVWIQCSRVDVDVRVKFLNGYIITSCLQQLTDGR